MASNLLQVGPPPNVVFEQRAVEDREATIKASTLKLKDVDYAIIYRAGSNNSVEKTAAEWFDDIEKKSRESPPMFPPEWVVFYRQRYKQWKDGQEMSPMGFPIRQWAQVTKAQAENLAMARILTVEELAQATEEMLARIGMGGRALKETAKAWLESSKGNKGQELAALRAENTDLKAQLDNQGQKIAELEAAIMSLSPQGAPRKRA
jgi:hypothetical protein